MPDLLNFNVIANIKTATAKRGPEFLESLVDNFLANSLKLITEINESFEQNDFKQISKIAHKLKGTAASLGAEQLAQLCFEIETTDYNTEIGMLIKQLSDCYNKTQPEIKQAFITK